MCIINNWLVYTGAEDAFTLCPKVLPQQCNCSTCIPTLCGLKGGSLSRNESHMVWVVLFPPKQSVPCGIWDKAWQLPGLIILRGCDNPVLGMPYPLDTTQVVFLATTTTILSNEWLSKLTSAAGAECSQMVLPSILTPPLPLITHLQSLAVLRPQRGEVWQWVRERHSSPARNGLFLSASHWINWPTSSLWRVAVVQNSVLQVRKWSGYRLFRRTTCCQV